jgi:hypothetical protein
MDHRRYSRGNDRREHSGEPESMGCRQCRARPEDADRSHDQEYISTNVGCQNEVSADYMQQMWKRTDDLRDSYALA